MLFRAFVGERAADALFVDRLAAAPPIPLTIEPSTHCHLLENVVVRAASGAYAFLPGRKRKAWLADTTLTYIHDRKALRKYVRCVDSFRIAPLRALFAVWAKRSRSRWSVRA